MRLEYVCVCECECVCVYACVLSHVLLFVTTMDCSLPGSSVHGNLQVRRFRRQPHPSSGNLPDRSIEQQSPALQTHNLTYSISDTIYWEIASDHRLRVQSYKTIPPLNFRHQLQMQMCAADWLVLD